jgi:hypothetical protein
VDGPGDDSEHDDAADDGDGDGGDSGSSVETTPMGDTEGPSAITAVELH